MVFQNVSQDSNRRSEVWKSFLLDKEKLLAKCELCYEKVGTEKIMQVTGQNATCSVHPRHPHQVMFR